MGSNITMISISTDICIFLVHIAIAFFLSFFVGLERQWRRRSIGLRMNVLVCIGSLMFTHASLCFLNSDVSRVASQIVCGIGFLGAGIIIKDENRNITGLNTAATVWCSAAIGLLCGIGLIIEAILGTIFVLLSNIFLRKISYQLSEIEPTKDGYHYYSLKIACKPKNMPVVRNELVEFSNKEHICIDTIDVIEKTMNKCTIIVKVKIPGNKLNFIEHLMNAMTLNDNIISIGWKKEDNNELKESEI